MTDDDFRKLANTFGFAPSRALRELIDCATAQMVLDEREACAKAADEAHELMNSSFQGLAAAIRARGTA